MAFEPQPYVEHANLRVPIALIVDDPAPCINPLWYFRHQVDGQAEPAHERTIPLDFMAAWCEWIKAAGIRGDFTVLPFPAGLGRVDDRLEGYDVAELRAWMDLARQVVAPQFDIHCEILTHTNALDLKSWQMLPISEHAWTDRQDEQTLADYFTAAMRILGDAGLPNNGLTQPCTYNGDESLYARALLAAEKRVNQRKVTHNFLHQDSVSHHVPPRITYLDEQAGEAVVSIWCATKDFIWNTQERNSPEATLSPQLLADRFLTEDGERGRLLTLLRGGGPLIIVTHWQSLYANGSRLGLDTYREVAARIENQFGAQVEWSKLSMIAQRFLAAQTVRMKAWATYDAVTLTVDCPFDSDILTISVPMPWPLTTGPEVAVDLRPYAQVDEPSDLRTGGWLMRGSVVTLSVPIVANVQTTITIRARP
jgi:hypothetical protein